MSATTLSVDFGYGGREPVTVTLTVPDLGLSPQQWAQAVYVATNVASTLHYGQPGAEVIATALAALPGRGRHQRLQVGDTVHVVTASNVTLSALSAEPVDAWGLPTAMFRHDPYQPPPTVYATDARDRVWTGRGADGLWRCLGYAGREPTRLPWEQLEDLHGPMTPLVPVVQP